MPIERRSTTPIRFGPFEVDSVSGELRKHGVRVKLQEQPLQILERYPALFDANEKVLPYCSGKASESDLRQ